MSKSDKYKELKGKDFAYKGVYITAGGKQIPYILCIKPALLSASNKIKLKKRPLQTVFFVSFLFVPNIRLKAVRGQKSYAGS